MTRTNLSAREWAEAELGRTGALVSEIVEERKTGDRDESRGNSDDDLLGAVEGLETAIRNWRLGSWSWGSR